MKKYSKKQSRAGRGSKLRNFYKFIEKVLGIIAVKLYTTDDHEVL